MPSRTRPADESTEEPSDPPTGGSERDLLVYWLRSADRTSRSMAREVSAHNAGAAVRHAELMGVLGRGPGPWERRAAFGFTAALVLFLVSLVAQSRGLDAGAAAEAAQRVFPVAAEAGP
jgi:hypothetical protein